MKGKQNRECMEAIIVMTNNSAKILVEDYDILRQK